MNPFLWWIARQRRPVEWLQTQRFRWRHRGDRPVIVVHQMARVGSVTVFRALRRRLPQARNLHTHYLHPDTIRRFETQFDRMFAVTRRAGLHRELMAARLLREWMERGHGTPWKVITLVRDPVARTVSAFFKHFEINFPDVGGAYRDDPVNVPGLIDLFITGSEFENAFALGWFDREMRDVLDIDVYAAPFPRDQGFAVLRGPVCEVLILRLEDLERIGAAALESFLQIDGVQLATANEGVHASYGASYRRFLEQLRLPGEYLDRMYGSRLATHFYSGEEIAGFRARWERGAGA